MRVALLGLLLALAGQAWAGDEPLGWGQLQQFPLPAAGQRIAYGAAEQQFGELRIPAGAGPFPVVVLLHGGCWLDAFDYRYITHLAAAITASLNVATWTPEYRRIGDAGGGWPGTLLDAAAATDHLRELAASHHLDLGRVVIVGHSAGGHLALWLAARPRLPAGSELYRPQPLPIRGVVGLAAIADLAAYRLEGGGGCNEAVEELLGGAPSRFPARYAQSSPRQLLPLGVPQWLVQGRLDPIVGLDLARAYAGAGRQAGDRVELRVVDAAGHFEPAVPETSAWPAVLGALRAALQ